MTPSLLFNTTVVLLLSVILTSDAQITTNSTENSTLPVITGLNFTFPDNPPPQTWVVVEPPPIYGYYSYETLPPLYIVFEPDGTGGYIEMPYLIQEEMHCGVASIYQPAPIVSQTRRRRKRVIGGTDSNYGEHPWVAAIYVRQWAVRNNRLNGNRYHDLGHVCGATLISDRHLVTAAHCVDSRKRNYQSLYVKLGMSRSTKSNYGHQVRDVVEIKIHPQFDNNSATLDSAFDIAILKLRYPVEFTNYVQPACLPDVDDSNLHRGTLTTALGWGATTGNGTASADVLQKVRLSTLSNIRCLMLTNSYTTICAGDFGQTNKSPCSGDSGGPLMWQNPDDTRWYLRGVTKFGGKICGSTPSGFTNVKWFVGWIKSIITE